VYCSLQVLSVLMLVRCPVVSTTEVASRDQTGPTPVCVKRVSLTEGSNTQETFNSVRIKFHCSL